MLKLYFFMEALVSGEKDVVQHCRERGQRDEKRAQEQEAVENAWPLWVKNLSGYSNSFENPKP